jgi:hypothetical protein
MLSMVVGATVNEIDGQILFGGEPRVTTAVVHLAEVNPKFRAAMLKFLEVSVYAEIAAAMAPIAMLIAANHNLIKIPEPMLIAMAAQLGLKIRPSRSPNGNGYEEP